MGRGSIEAEHHSDHRSIQTHKAESLRCQLLKETICKSPAIDY
ncbi:hypothetical protein BRPE64_ECDS00590 (plasmid) [Caballeronia insecticola]|uniref:Uncharacterized protein n=1 Tax=Caballeronia insecticola TaxID=758793 RepID=R4X5H0_9BURK|nr:hypothetical protein BRPE64_ECDS00590 [Caballeronia insecticola]